MAEQNIVSKIIEPLTGIKVPHYVAGRLLTPDDLKADQDATLRRDAILGQAVGYGIIDGFWVTAEYPNGGTEKVLLKISSGTAITYAGELLQLHSDEGHSFPVREDVPNSPIFQPFEEVGAYLLTVGLAQESIGSVPTFGIESTTKKRRISRWDDNNGCTEQWLINGLQFKLFDLGNTFAADTIPNQPESALMHRIRNRLAQWGFGDRAGAASPFGSAGRLSGIEILAEQLGIGFEHDVPLAVLYCDVNTDSDPKIRSIYPLRIRFVDNWSVRRRLVHPTPPLADPPVTPFNAGFLTDRIIAEGEARLLQFQEHLDDIRLNPTPNVTLAAQNFFTYLPPAGYIPLQLTDNLIYSTVYDLLARVLQAAQKYIVPPESDVTIQPLPVFLHPQNTPLEFYVQFPTVLATVLTTMIQGISQIHGNVVTIANAIGYLDDLSPAFTSAISELFKESLKDNSVVGEFNRAKAVPSQPALALDTFFGTPQPGEQQPLLRLSYASPGRMIDIAAQAAQENMILVSDIIGIDIVLPDIYRYVIWAIVVDWIARNGGNIPLPAGSPVSRDQFATAWGQGLDKEVTNILGATPGIVINQLRNGTLSLPPFYALYFKRLSDVLSFNLQTTPQAIPALPFAAGGVIGVRPPSPGRG